MTNVAAIHPTLESVRVKAGEIAFVFNGQIGDALTGVNVKRSLQGTCGTGLQAFRAATAAVGQLLTSFCYQFLVKEFRDL